MSSFNLESNVILIIGGGGILCNSETEYLLSNAATFVILDYKDDIIDTTVTSLEEISNKVIGGVCDAKNSLLDV